MTNEKWDHLNRPLGYEVARLLIDSKLSFSDIKRDLPYDDVNDNELNRVLSGEGTEVEIFTIPKTRGGVKYTLNLQLFSKEELEMIRTRARARISDNLPEKDLHHSPKAEDTAPHLDVANMKSRFS